MCPSFGFKGVVFDEVLLVFFTKIVKVGGFLHL